jgi:hypothetical protein
MIYEQKLYRGIDWFWIDTFKSYPATSHSCYLTILQNKEIVLQVDATANGADHQFLILFKDNVLTNGIYQYQYTFTANGVAVTPYSGEFIVYTGTHDEQMLAALYAAQLRLVGRDYVQMSVNGRSVTFKNDADIARQINAYERKIGLKRTPKILTRFV